MQAYHHSTHGCLILVAKIIDVGLELEDTTYPSRLLVIITNQRGLLSHLPTIPVSYPNKKPAVQMKYPKKYARKAPSLVPGKPMLCDVVHTDYVDDERRNENLGREKKLEAHLHAFKSISSPMLNYPIRITAEIQHATCSVGYAIARHITVLSVHPSPTEA